MPRLRLSLLLLGLSATVATAQQPAAPPPIPLVPLLLPYVEDENFGKELKLTPDQVKKFVAFRKSQWDEQYTTVRAEYPKSVADRRKATVALFKDVLTAEQHKRAAQLAAQSAWNNPGGRLGGAAITPPDVTKAPASVLRQYADIADPLNLSDEQKKLVAAGGGDQFGPVATSVFLTAEQSKVAKELLGEPVKTAWNSAFDARLNRFFGGQFGGAPGPLGLTEAKDVRTEIGMTDEQVKALAPLLTKWRRAPVGGRQGDDFSPEAAAKQIGELATETDKAIAATLKPEQLSRFKQIERQTANFGFGRGGGNPFGGPIEPVPLSSHLQNIAFKKELGFTAEQDKSLADADKAQADAIEKAALSDRPVEDAIKAITAANDGREKAYAAVLTAEQTKKLDEMMGKPFTGSTARDRNNPFGGPSADQLKQIRTANFGQRTLGELTLLSQNPSIRDDLKLSPEQVKKATDALAEYRTKIGPGDARIQTPEERAKAAAERAAFDAKTIDSILTADQAKRLRELMLQRAEFFFNQNNPGGFNTGVGAVGYPGVADAVKLTAEQKKKLLDDGAKPDEVLTADQKTAIKGMLGKKFDGDFSDRPPGGPGQRPTAMPTTAAVLLNVSWDVFKITPEQAAKLVPVANEYQLETIAERPIGGGPPGGMGGGFTQISPAKLAAANDKLAKALAAVLTPEQAKRVEQVRYQLVAVGTGTSYLTNAEVAKALGLKDEQKAKIATALADNQRLQSAALGSSRTFGGTQAWVPKLIEKTTARVMAVLTDEQKAAWKALTGDPVPNLRPINPFGGFGGGGFGGGGF